MNYYVKTSDGRMFGPADISTLNKWILEDRINTETILATSSTGAEIKAYSVQGLVFSKVALSGVASATEASLITADDLKDKQFFAIAEDGQYHGPAGIKELNHWIETGRVKPSTDLEDASTNKKIKACDVVGLVFPVIEGIDEAVEEIDDHELISATKPPRLKPADPEHRAAHIAPKLEGSAQVTWSFLFSAFGIIGFLLPLLFPILGLVVGFKARALHHPLGHTCVLVGWISLGTNIGYWLVRIVIALVNRSPEPLTAQF